LDDCQTQLQRLGEQFPIFNQITSSTQRYHALKDRLSGEADEETKRKDNHNKWNADTTEKLSTVVSILFFSKILQF
jgi:hypothetical protein